MSSITAMRLDPRLCSDVVRWLPAALAGNERSPRRYARAWRELVGTIVAEHPDAPPSTVDVLEHLALTAPFDPDGPLRELVSVAAGIIPEMRDATIPRTRRPGRPPATDFRGFARAVLIELGRAGSGLERLMRSWDLSITDVARLFGVRRQAVQQWLDEGVPAARRVKLLGISEIGDLLDRNLVPERIPGVVRAPSPAFGGRSMLEAIAADRQEEVLEDVRRSFDWAWSA
jgi:hypothetical protein